MTRDAEAFVSARLLMETPWDTIHGPITPFVEHLAAQGYEVIAWQYDQPPDRHGYVITRLKARPQVSEGRG